MYFYKFFCPVYDLSNREETSISLSVIRSYLSSKFYGHLDSYSF